MEAEKKRESGLDKEAKQNARATTHPLQTLPSSKQIVRSANGRNTAAADGENWREKKDVGSCAKTMSSKGGEGPGEREHRTDAS